MAEKLDALVMDPATRERGITPEYLAAVRPRGRSFRRGPVGCAEPRLFTPPLRDLTSETSLGFEVIDFAETILGVELYPWQKVLLIRGLELLEDGKTYRFRRLVVIVGRQNGKTMLAGVLAAWWLFVDSKRHPDRVPPFKFKVLGVAQNLDTARQPWDSVKQWCDPDPETEEAAALTVETLQGATEKVIDSNGKEVITTLAKPHYMVRAAKSARGKPSARVIFDELREQATWDAWNAVAHTTKSFFNNQIWGFSNAGYLASLVLKSLRDGMLQGLADWVQYVESGIQTLEEFANGRSLAAGIFEWSAPPGCARDDVQALLQSNPSIGYGELTIAACLDDIDTPEYPTEVLGHWVSSKLPPFLDLDKFALLKDPASAPAPKTRIIAGVSVTVDGRAYFSHVGIAGAREDGLLHGEVIARREGHLWVLDYLDKLRAKQGITEVAIASKGVPSAELVPMIEKAGFTVHKIEGTPSLLVASHLRNLIERGGMRHRGQEPLDLAVGSGTTRSLSGMPVWDLFESPVDVAPVVSINLPLWALENTEAPKKKAIPPPPPPAKALTRSAVDGREENLATVRF